MQLLDYTFLGNSVLDWTLAALAFAFTFLVIPFVRARIRAHRLKWRGAGDSTALDLLGVLVSKTSRIVLLVLALYIASEILTLPPAIDRATDIIIIVGVWLQVGIWATAALRFLVTRRAATDPAAQSSVGVLMFVGQLLSWAIFALLALDNLGINITALVAGLGIGGIAIALAVQNILSDLLASVSIILDKPFEAGDFIIVDNMMGTVENIGIKTTRLQSLSGERLVFPNSNLINSRIRNFRHMRERRVVFTLGVVYQTPAAQIEAIPGLIKEAIEAQANARFDRANFKEYGDSALLFEAVYYVTDPDYNLYMNVHEAINLGIMHRFQARDIEFAYPTRTLYLSSTVTAPGLPPDAHPVAS